MGPDGPVTGRAAYRRRMAVVAVLAAERGRPVGRERLLGLLWPDHPPAAARHTLSEALYVLRKELGEDTFVVSGGEVGLDLARVRTDLDDFLSALADGRMEDAVRAYGGPFLGSFTVPGAVEFERWAEGERDLLAAAHARALQSLAESAEARGDLLHAAEWWRRLAQSDPFSSRVALRLARVLWNAGEHAAALRHAEAHAAYLHAELEIGPEPELAEFVARLRAESILLPAVSRTVPPVVPSPEADPLPPPASHPVAIDPPSAGFLASVLAQPAAPLPPFDTDAKGPASSGCVCAATVSAGAPPRTGRPGDPASAPSKRAKRGWARRELLAAATVATLGTVGFALSARELPPPHTFPTEPDPHRIAVLYFDDDSRGRELEYLAGGLTEMLIDELGRVPALDVISRNGVKPYRSGTVPLDSVSARLRVGTLVEGSVQRAGDSVRVSVQLIDARTQSRLDSRVVVRPLGDVLALESDLAAEVGGFLRRRLGDAVRLRQIDAGTRSAPARALVLRAEQAMRDAARVGAGTDLLDAQSAARLWAVADSLLRVAAVTDPRWTRPLLLRGELVLEQWHGAGLADRPALLRVARRLAESVLAREPRSGQALCTRGVAVWREVEAAGVRAPALLDAAERDLRASVAADPSLAACWGALARVQLARGRLAEAALTADRALAADTYLEDSPKLVRQVFHVALAAGDWVAAQAACERGGTTAPREWRFVECRLILLRDDLRRPPDPAAAWRLVERLEQLDPPAHARAQGRPYAPLFRDMVAAHVSARAGDAVRARAVLARARAQAARDPSVRTSLTYDEACLLLLLGDTASARGRVEAYLAARPGERALLARDPMLRGVFAPAPVSPPAR